MNRKARAVLAAIAVSVVLLARCSACGERPLRMGTYNIEQFGHTQKKTDMDRLVAIVAGADPDVLAIQEIQSEARAKELAERLSKGPRSYAVALSGCGGGSKMHLGVLYDANRVTVTGTQEYPELDPAKRGQCATGERPGFAVQLDDRKRKLWMLVIHLAAHGTEEMFEKRKVQWRKAHAIAKTLGADGTPVAILGDTNSTGWLDGRFDERKFIETEAESAGKVVATRDLACSEYWQPRREDDAPSGELAASLLDHVVAPPGLVRKRSVTVHSFCRELRCKTTDRKPEDYQRVSDHCPVTFEIEPGP